MDRDVISAIGNTPLVELTRMSPKPSVRIFAKLEGQNPTGSLKDRIAKYMIEDAERTGALTPDKTILEPTSGNTGIALAMIGRLKGYKVRVVIPENITEERKQLLALYGAEMIFSEGKRGTNGSIEMAHALAAADPNYCLLYQYGNEANPRAHYETTGAEIVRDLPEVDVLVAGLGTGGTLMGVGRRLREANPGVKIIAAEPHPGDTVQGLRSLEEGFIPPILDQSLLDGKIMVDSKTAFAMTKELTQKEAIFAGVSSGAVVLCAIRAAMKMDRGTIVCVFCDGGWKYMSLGIWQKEVGEYEEGIQAHVWW